MRMEDKKTKTIKVKLNAEERKQEQHYQGEIAYNRSTRKNREKAS